MSRSVGSDISNSRRAFVNLVWPQISERWFGGAELEPVEDERDSLKHAMDSISGVDYWTVGDNLQSIASRVQNCNYSTFTIRMRRNQTGNDTEFQKRKHALDSEGLSPDWVVQAYVDVPVDTNRRNDTWRVNDGELLNAAIAKEDELIKWVDNGDLGCHYGVNGTGSNNDVGEDEDFYYVHWIDYDRYDRYIKWLNRPRADGVAPPQHPRFDPISEEPPQNQTKLNAHYSDD